MVPRWEASARMLTGHRPGRGPVPAGTKRQANQGPHEKKKGFEGLRAPPPLGITTNNFFISGM
ncbi:hypothetical protein PspLS_06262 [Pyricularia sp. CBS 133598]|nr:hypothetical protein PspLS_06262 [Pyricularia sp. CBS 133598]